MHELDFLEGEPIEIFLDIPIQVTYLRNDVVTSYPMALPKGRYIVETLPEITEGGAVVLPAAGWVALAKADWDENGEITFHSTKHKYLVQGAHEMDMLKRAVRDRKGPLDWYPET